MVHNLRVHIRIFDHLPLQCKVHRPDTQSVRERCAARRWCTLAAMSEVEAHRLDDSDFEEEGKGKDELLKTRRAGRASSRDGVVEVQEWISVAIRRPIGTHCAVHFAP